MPLFRWSRAQTRSPPVPHHGLLLPYGQSIALLNPVRGAGPLGLPAKEAIHVLQRRSSL